jgi:hypothetical protein
MNPGPARVLGDGPGHLEPSPPRRGGDGAWE